MGKGLFIIGTGTDVGKTYISGLMVKKLQESGVSAAYYKGAMSGNPRRANGSLIPGDALSVKEMAGIHQPLEEMCPYLYEHAVSPHLASRIEGNPIQMQVMLDRFQRLCEAYEYVTVEGSGGILCPLCYEEEPVWLVDMIRACNLGCLLVADAGLGTINAVGLTAYYLKQNGILLKGIVFNRFQPGNMMHEDNRKICEELTGGRVIACVREGERDLKLSAEELQAFYE